MSNINVITERCKFYPLLSTNIPNGCHARIYSNSDNDLLIDAKI